MTRKTPKLTRRKRGFEHTGGLLGAQIRKAGEKRGFAVAKLLTHWAEIVGEDLARAARPVKVGYGKGGFGATLTVLTTGAQAPMLAMQKEQMRERVNTCYGYAAISRINITQTAPTGFAEGQVEFTQAPKVRPAPAPEIIAEAKAAAAPVTDDALREALESLGRNVLTRSKRN